MLCEQCPLFEKCDSPCDTLQKKLQEVDTYQREIPFSSDRLTYLVEQRQRDGLIETPDECRAPDDLLEEDEGTRNTMYRGRTLDAQLRRLPRQQRLCVYLRYWKGLRVTAIAEALDLKKCTVTLHLKRAKGVMRGWVFMWPSVSG